MQMWHGTCLHAQHLVLLSPQTHIQMMVVDALRSCVNIVGSVGERRKSHLPVLQAVSDSISQRT